MDVKISDDIVKVLLERVKNSDEFNSVEEYINYILKQIIDKLENKSDSSLSSEDEERVKKRLRGLGYLT